MLTVEITEPTGYSFLLRQAREGGVKINPRFIKDLRPIARVFHRLGWHLPGY
jgi:hypothetical protein